MIGQPIEIAIGPPAFHAWPKVVKVPARTEMIVNEIAKFVKPLQARVQLLLVAELGEPLLVAVVRAGPQASVMPLTPSPSPICVTESAKLVWRPDLCDYGDT